MFSTRSTSCCQTRGTVCLSMCTNAFGEIVRPSEHLRFATVAQPPKSWLSTASLFTILSAFARAEARSHVGAHEVQEPVVGHCHACRRACSRCRACRLSYP